MYVRAGIKDVQLSFLGTMTTMSDDNTISKPELTQVLLKISIQ